MSYSVGRELEDYITSKVTAGEYQNQSEVVRDALRRMKREDEDRQLRLLELNRDIDAGVHQLEKGHRVSGEDSKKRRAALYEAPAGAAR